MKPGNRPAILDNPNLSEIAKSNPLPLDGVARNFREALRYVHFPPATAPATATATKPILQEPILSEIVMSNPLPLEKNLMETLAYVHKSSAPTPATNRNATMPLDHIVHGQPPSELSYAVQGAAPSFMMQPKQPLLPTNVFGATTPSNSVQCAASSFVMEQHLQESAMMLSHRIQEQMTSQVVCQLQSHLINTFMIRGANAPCNQRQDPTATLLTGHQDYKTLPVNQAMPEAGTEHDHANSSISSDDWTPDSLSWLDDTDFEDDLSFGEFLEE